MLANLNPLQFYMIISLSIFLVEIGFFLYFKKAIQPLSNSDPIIDQIQQFYIHVQSYQIAVYIGVYCGLLLLSKFFIWLFFGIFLFQALSLMSNIMILLKIKKERLNE